MSVYYPDQPVVPPSPYSYYFLNPVLISPFQLEGHGVSRRDDIYRAFESFMDVLTRGALGRLFDLAERLDTEPSAPESPETRPRLHKLKSAMDFCVLFPSENSSITCSGMEEDLRGAVCETFTGLMSMKIQLESIGNKNFSVIQTLLREIQSLVRSPSSHTPNYLDLITKAQEIVNLLYP